MNLFGLQKIQLNFAYRWLALHHLNVKIINDAMPTTYMLNSTGSFVNQISSFNFKPSHVLVSYDVVSLFINIPLNETIDIVCNYVYKQHSPPIYSKETYSYFVTW